MPVLWIVPVPEHLGQGGLLGRSVMGSPRRWIVLPTDKIYYQGENQAVKTEPGGPPNELPRPPGIGYLEAWRHRWQQIRSWWPSLSFLSTKDRMVAPVRKVSPWMAPQSPLCVPHSPTHWHRYRIARRSSSVGLLSIIRDHFADVAD